MSFLSTILAPLRGLLPKKKVRMHLLTNAEILKTFGDPGPGPTDATAAWKKANLLTCRDGNGNRPSMPGVPKNFYFMTHRLVEERMRDGFARAAAAAPDYEIVTAASFVYRHKRHDPDADLSRHSWGVAVDIDSAKNGAHTFAAGKYVQPWSPAWLALWPHGLPQAFVEAFEAAGFVWGGRWTDYCDPMHFEIGK